MSKKTEMRSFHFSGKVFLLEKCNHKYVLSSSKSCFIQIFDNYQNPRLLANQEYVYMLHLFVQPECKGPFNKYLTVKG